MRTPKIKKIPEHINGLLPNLVVSGLKNMYEGRRYDEHPGPCPRCHADHWKRHEWMKHSFCKVITQTGIEPIFVQQKMWRCLDCGCHVVSKGPFTYGRDYADPIIDLALGLHSAIPAANAREKFLTNIGIQLDRDTILIYEREFGDKAAAMAPIGYMAGKPLGVNVLRLLYGASTAGELKAKLDTGPMASVTDETYPRIKGSKKKQRIAEYEARREGKEPPKYPDSFTLAMTYLPAVKGFSSLIASPGAFNSLMAMFLFNVVKDIDLNLTDGNPAYNVFKKRVNCIIHRFRNKIKNDPKLKEMKKNKCPRQEITDYLKKKFREFLEKELDEIEKDHPEFVSKDGGGKAVFNGPTSTNAIEGGNWRIKEATRPQVERLDTFQSRAILAVVNDSIKTFVSGHPAENKCAHLLQFDFAKVMRFVKPLASPDNIRYEFDPCGKIICFGPEGQIIGVA